MTAARIEFTTKHRDALLAGAHEARPCEACGLLVGLRRGEVARVERVVRAPNISMEEDRFEVDPGAVVATTDEAAREGLEVIGVWHSHPDGPARPSTLDRAAAWPGLSQVIVGDDGNGAADVRSYFAPDAGGGGGPHEEAVAWIRTPRR